MNNSLICPILTSSGPAKQCVQDKCMMWVAGDTSSACGLVKLPRKTVIRMDTISAQLQELQILVNQLASQ